MDAAKGPNAVEQLGKDLLVTLGQNEQKSLLVRSVSMLAVNNSPAVHLKRKHELLNERSIISVLTTC